MESASECIGSAIDCVPFEKEAQEVIKNLDDTTSEYDLLEELDVSVLKESFLYDDGISYNPYDGYIEPDMKIIVKYLKKSMSKLVELIGNIDGLPEADD